MNQKNLHKDSENMRFALHEYFQPVALSIIGGLVGIILWFGMKAYEKIDAMDEKITQVMVSVGEMKTNNIVLVECNNGIKKDVEKQNKEIKFIEIALAGKGIEVKNEE